MTDTTQAAGLTDEQERKAFEAEFRNAFPNFQAVTNAGIFERHASETDTYAHTLPLVGWRMWKARAALAAQAVPDKWVDAVCSAAFDEEGWVIDPDLAEVHAEMLAASPAPAEAKEGR